jgi:hypothetical protein
MVLPSLGFFDQRQNTATAGLFRQDLSFRDGPKDQTRNLEIPGSMLRITPE